MKEIQRAIIELRASGLKIREIADALGLTYDTVKSYCHRTKVVPGSILCKQCGLPISKGYRKFCSEKCRQEWWKLHRKEELKTLYHYECEYCHKEFSLLRNMNQKYCSHDCYIKARYGNKDGNKND